MLINNRISEICTDWNQLAKFMRCSWSKPSSICGTSPRKYVRAHRLHRSPLWPTPGMPIFWVNIWLLTWPPLLSYSYHWRQLSSYSCESALIPLYFWYYLRRSSYFVRIQTVICQIAGYWCDSLDHCCLLYSSWTSYHGSPGICRNRI